jgi:flagellar motor switch protein FliM
MICQLQEVVMEDAERDCGSAESVEIDELLSRRLEQTAANFSQAAVDLLGKETQARILRISGCNYGIFLRDACGPACCYALRASPDMGHLVIYLPTRLLGLLLARMLGVIRPEEVQITLPLGEIESCLVDKIVQHFCQAFRAAWHDFLPFELAIESAATGPQSWQFYAEDLSVCIAEIELESGGEKANMKWILPADWRRRMAAVAGERNWSTTGATSPEAAADELVARLAETKMSAKELAGLSVGDVITTDKDVGEPIDIVIDSVVKFRANLGKSGKKKAVQIIESIEPPEQTEARPE